MVGTLEKTDPRRSIARSYDMQYHGTADLRGGNCPRSRYYDRGRFGRMFGNLPGFQADPAALRELGKAGGPMDGGQNNPDHPNGLGAGFTFLGQFIDHDITFDPTSSLERQADPEAVSNFRTPTLELDNLYGAGPGASPFLYRRDDRSQFLLGLDTAERPNDLPRNQEGIALIGDPRNDENLIVSQLHVALLKFHNAVATQVAANPPAGKSVFEEAQRLVRWHYQWMILHEFLPLIVGQELVSNILKEGRKFYKWRNEPFIPVEFSVAAYRFGHSQVRPGYRISTDFARPLFSPPGAVATPGDVLPSDLSGGRRIAPEQVVEWNRFFSTGGNTTNLQIGKRFDTLVSPPLLNLPFASGSASDPQSLPVRNLLRGHIFGLPSGQDVAVAMGEVPLTADEIGQPASDLGFGESTPLFFYCLKEAEVKANGVTLGPVGGRIVAEVFIGLIQGDKSSYLRTDPRWRPHLGKKGAFSMVDLLKFAGVVS